MQAAPARGAAAQRETWSTGRTGGWRKRSPKYISQGIFLEFSTTEEPLSRPSHTSAPDFDDVFFNVRPCNMRTRPAASVAVVCDPRLPPCPRPTPKLVCKPTVGERVLETLPNLLTPARPTCTHDPFCGVCEVAGKSLVPFSVIQRVRMGGFWGVNNGGNGPFSNCCWGGNRACFR